MFPEFGSGLPGMMSPMMGGMFGGGKQSKGGFDPMMMSPLLYMLHNHPNIGLGMISPLAGGMRALGLFK